MLLDLDGFKDINDTLGHTAGDNVLELMAHRLYAGAPGGAFVARLGGDEFAVLMKTGDVLAVMEAAQQLLIQLREPLRADGIEILPSASIGIAVHTDSETTGTEILRRADVAMYGAKNMRTGVALYEPEHDNYSKPRLMLAEDLRRALSEHQLELWYQPQIDASTQELCGLEALIRWPHPTQGLLPPVAFLPIARQVGLMPALSAEVARIAAADLARWREDGVTVRVALNCAPPELLSGTFVRQLYAALEHESVPTSQVVIEVTEDSFIADPETARQVLADIRAHGLQVSIDDYGTGFSSLAYLRDLPVDELKIDRTFAGSVITDPRSKMIVAFTIQMAAALGMRTVAEGVEDAEAAAELVALGIDVLQGYHLARPMPDREVVPWTRHWQSSNPSFDGRGALPPMHDEAWRHGRLKRSSPVRAAHPAVPRQARKL